MKILNHCYPKSPQPTTSTPYKAAKSPQLETVVEITRKRKKERKRRGKKRRGEEGNRKVRKKKRSGYPVAFN